jgi:hypothetical protein
MAARVAENAYQLRKSGQWVRDEVAGDMVALRSFCPCIALEARFNT